MSGFGLAGTMRRLGSGFRELASLEFRIIGRLVWLWQIETLGSSVKADVYRCTGIYVCVIHTIFKLILNHNFVCLFILILCVPTAVTQVLRCIGRIIIIEGQPGHKSVKSANWIWSDNPKNKQNPICGFDAGYLLANKGICSFR